MTGMGQPKLVILYRFVHTDRDNDKGTHYVQRPIMLILIQGVQKFPRKVMYPFSQPSVEGS